LNRFANGVNGKSINYKDQWMTPQEFENQCEITPEFKSLDNIQSEILTCNKVSSLQLLIMLGKLRLHSHKCRCSICCAEEKQQMETEMCCTICQDFEVGVGHESMQCPKIVCLKCGQKGHTKIHCLFNSENLPFPDEIFIKILGYLDVIDTMQCAQVSKKLRKICMDKSLNVLQRSFTFTVPAINGKTILEVKIQVCNNSVYIDLKEVSIQESGII
jgi:hypothetical protein